MAEGILLIISGPSGVGKGTVCRRLLEICPSLELSVSTTTRPPRSNEKEGREYYFRTKEIFKKMIESGDFLEWASVHGHFYGTTYGAVREAISNGRDMILEIDVQGAAQVRKKMPRCLTIFLAPPSLQELEGRITGRGTEDEALIRRRLLAAREEIKAYQLYDYVVVNDQVDEAAKTVEAIIKAEKCSVKRGARPPAGEVKQS